ncbi:hypothetical protein [Sphingobium sp.]|uniref:hypothetical protein n=1 Tax=Sphingobium sp. TaxID=1912891 RepID=UPI002B8BACB8|nr:hypothetical protein [Sphingobium sp.]HUD92364.1 hypothetical protein [Sphingobium sp.]
MTVHRLNARGVSKPWGITDVPSAFQSVAGDRVGEVWFTDGRCDIAVEGAMHALAARVSSQGQG